MTGTPNGGPAGSGHANTVHGIYCLMSIHENRWTPFCHWLVSLPRHEKMALMILADAVALPLCVLASMLLRLADIELTASYGIDPYILVTAITLAIFAASGLYRAVIRFIDKQLLARAGISLAIVISVAFLISYSFDERHLPRNVLMIYWFIAFSYVVSSRLTVRSFLRQHTNLKMPSRNAVAIYGAGEAGVQLAQAMKESGQYQPVCFFDDKHQFTNQTVAGLKVYHIERHAEIVSQMRIGMVVLAIPDATPARRRHIVNLVRDSSISVKILNHLIDLGDKIDGQSIRDIRIEDLLGRVPVAPQQVLFAKCIRGKNVLVTGAGGSIGSELCRQIMSMGPKSLHLLDHCEFALYTIQQELESKYENGTHVLSHLGSVCESHVVKRVLTGNAIDTVYHAAAYKHVPLVESNVAEGIRNNVIGAQLIAHYAQLAKVETCVLISTDKAVRPTNIMGASKRIAELVFQAAAARSRGSTTFCMVRFGNVLGSSGSVVPLFQKQIESGEAVTITHPEVMRYFMLIPEAAQLVIQAGAMASGGEVFVLDMGEPVKIVDLARAMIALAGLEEKTSTKPNGDVPIRFIGLRPGEKLYEELLIGADTLPSPHPKIMRAREYAIDPPLLDKVVADLCTACADNHLDHIRSVVQMIVKEYSPQEPVLESGEPIAEETEEKAGMRHVA
jgi:FlaA1/EpsC-like NDP-sugar epimerase